MGKSYYILVSENEELKRQNRELVAKVERLEKVAEASRVVLGGSMGIWNFITAKGHVEKFVCDECGMKEHKHNCIIGALEKALANLEGGGE